MDRTRNRRIESKEGSNYLRHVLRKNSLFLIFSFEQFDTSTPDFTSFNVTFGKVNEGSEGTFNTNGTKQGLESLEYLKPYIVEVGALFKIAGVEIVGSSATTRFGE